MDEKASFDEDWLVQQGRFIRQIHFHFDPNFARRWRLLRSTVERDLFTDQASAKWYRPTQAQRGGFPIAGIF